MSALHPCCCIVDSSPVRSFRAYPCLSVSFRVSHEANAQNPRPRSFDAARPPGAPRAPPIVQTLSRHGFSRKRAAESLGITRLDLWRRMRRLKIDVKRTSSGRPSQKGGSPEAQKLRGRPEKIDT